MDLYSNKLATAMKGSDVKLTTIFEKAMASNEHAAVDPASGRTDQLPKQLISRILKATNLFLRKNKLMNMTAAEHEKAETESMTRLTDSYNYSRMNAENSLDRIGVDAITSLVDAAKIPHDRRSQAICAVAAILAKTISNNDAKSYMYTHYSKLANEGVLTTEGLSNGFATARYLNSVANNGVGVASVEAFGAEMDKVMPDIQTNIAVTLLDFHYGISDAILNRRPITIPHVQYTVPFSNIYDNLLSNSMDRDEANHGSHVVPTIDLYHNPVPVSANLTPIVPRLERDTKGCLYKDNVILFNRPANLLQLSLEPDRFGFSHINRTDILSENIIVTAITILVKRPGYTDEYITLDVSAKKSSRLTIYANTNDSGNRGSILSYIEKLDKNTMTDAGTPSLIFGSTTATDRIRIQLDGSVVASIKYGDVNGAMGCNFGAYNTGGVSVPPSKEVSDLANEITITPIGYSLDARFSEENMRKSSTTVETHIRSFDYEIYNGKNFLIDHSIMGQNVPEYLMSLVAEITSIGQDHRNIEIITKAIRDTYDRNLEEYSDPNLRVMRERVGFDSIAGQMTKPTALMTVIDISTVDNISSGKFLEDLSGKVEWELLNMYAVYYYQSLYRQQLNGQKAVFKCLTSPIILDVVMSVYHMHDHSKAEPEVNNGTNKEYIRYLKNGTIMEIKTTCFEYMYDKLFAIPFKADNPESVLTFGQHWDCGTVVAHYSPQYENHIAKRILSNTRAQCIASNPSGFMMQFANIHLLVDLYSPQSVTAGLIDNPGDVMQQLIDEREAEIGTIV